MSPQSKKPTTKPTTKTSSKPSVKTSAKPTKKAPVATAKTVKVGTKTVKANAKPAKVTEKRTTTKPPKSTTKVSGKSGAKSADKTSAKPVSKMAGKKVSKNDKYVVLVSKPIAQEMMDRLCKRYPDADCELTFGSTFQLLTSVILSAQTTDVQVNKCTPALFKKFPTAKALAEANLDDVKELIKPTGYFNAKAVNIQKCAQALVAKFGGEVPKTLEELTQLPGVGRKTANVVLGVAYGVPGWTVDTHVQRLSGRLGLSKNTEPHKIEIDLQNLYPEKDWTKYSITLIWHGRRLCYARNPNCPECPINDICPSSQA